MGKESTESLRGFFPCRTNNIGEGPSHVLHALRSLRMTKRTNNAAYSLPWYLHHTFSLHCMIGWQMIQEKRQLQTKQTLFIS